jgi:mRNA interferase MazF
MGKRINRFDVFWINLDPTQGSEMSKKRPCVVLSPNEMNVYLKTVIIAPLTSTLKPLPSRISVFFDNREGMVALDHIRAVSKSRIEDYIGRLRPSEIQEIKESINEMLCQ